MGKRNGSLEKLELIGLTKMQFNSHFWNGKRVLVTGHTGFKGSWLCLWLIKLGAQITGVGLEPETDPALFTQLELSERIERHHIADIRELGTIQKIITESQPEVVLHLAAQPLVRRSYEDPLGTWSTNVQGSLNILEGLKTLNHHCAVVMVTTDKVYENQEWIYGYRENDRLGGHDPYSASKAAAELAIASWRKSFCGNAPHQSSNLAIATARAGNVIGGGDWAVDRIMPDAIRALETGCSIPVRNPESTRPWQHVLEPLAGYLLLAEALTTGHNLNQISNPYSSAYNFGPFLEANRPVRQLIEESLKHWPGDWSGRARSIEPHEAGRLHLNIDKAVSQLNWKPRWKFSATVARTVLWYRSVSESTKPYDACMKDIEYYQQSTSKPRA